MATTFIAVTSTVDTNSDGQMLWQVVPATMAITKVTAGRERLSEVEVDAAWVEPTESEKTTTARLTKSLRASGWKTQGAWATADRHGHVFTVRVTRG